MRPVKMTTVFSVLEAECVGFGVAGGHGIRIAKKPIRGRGSFLDTAFFRPRLAFSGFGWPGGLSFFAGYAQLLEVRHNGPFRGPPLTVSREESRGLEDRLGKHRTSRMAFYTGAERKIKCEKKTSPRLTEVRGGG
jgi:hypothetical protein